MGQRVFVTGATGVQADLFDRAAMRVAIAGHDTVAHLATHIPDRPLGGVAFGMANDRLVAPRGRRQPGKIAPNLVAIPPRRVAMGTPHPLR